MWCVCKIKATGELFIQSSIDREIMIDALRYVDTVNSIVLKRFDTEKEAQDYIDDINFSNDILNKII